MRIAVAVPYGLSESGLVIMASRLRDEFLKQGHDTVLVLSDSSGTPGFLPDSVRQERDINSWLLDNSAAYDVALWAGLYQESEAIAKQFRTSLYLRSVIKKRVFFVWERTGSGRTLPETTLSEDVMANASDGFFAFNQELLDELRTYRVPEGILFLMSPGVDTQTRFVPPISDAQRRDLKRSFKWPSNLTTVLYVGRFVRRKATDWLVKTWIEDRRLSEKAYLVLIGSGFGQRDSVEDRVHQLARSVPNVIVVPHRFESDWTSYYRAADLFVLASRWEGEPIVLSEAMACGLPVVATKIAGHMAMVQPERTGLFFEPGNASELLFALNRLIDDKGYREELGRNARHLVASRRDISVVAGNFLAVFSGSQSVLWP